MELLVYKMKLAGPGPELFRTSVNAEDRLLYTRSAATQATVSGMGAILVRTLGAIIPPGLFQIIVNR